MKRSGYDREQIDEALEKASFTLPEGELLPPPAPSPETWDAPSALDMTISQ
jgi:hypothetical protein